MKERFPKRNCSSCGFVSWKYIPLKEYLLIDCLQAFRTFSYDKTKPYPNRPSQFQSVNLRLLDGILKQSQLTQAQL